MIQYPARLVRLSATSLSRMGFKDVLSQTSIARFCKGSACGGDSDEKPFNVWKSSEQVAESRFNVLVNSLKRDPIKGKYVDKVIKSSGGNLEKTVERLERLDGPVTFQRTVDDLEVKSPHMMKKSRRSLDEVLKTDKLQDLTEEEIIQIWQTYHRGKPGFLSAVISEEKYIEMIQKAQENKIFLVPVKKEEGYKFYMMQYENNIFHITSLDQYHEKAENAPEVLSVSIYPELIKTISSALVRCEFDSDVLTVDEAHHILLQVYFYYGEANETRQKLLTAFNHEPSSFDYKDLIESYQQLVEEQKYLFDGNGDANKDRKFNSL